MYKIKILYPNHAEDCLSLDIVFTGFIFVIVI